MRRRRVGAPALALCVTTAACMGGARTSAEDEPVVAVVAVETAVARLDTFVVRVEALGEVVVQPGHEAVMAAPAESRVRDVFVVPGQRVERGESLVALDRSVWSAEVRRAEAAAEAAHSELDRARRLTTEGILPRRDLERAAADAASSDAELAAAHRVDDLSVVRSPMDGIVAEMNAVREATADPGTVLVRVIDPDALEAVFRLSPAAVARVAPGADVEVTASGSGDTLRAGGVVRAVSPALDAGTVAVRVRLTSTTRTLRVGESVTGRLAVTTHPDAVVIPVAALVPVAGGVRVFVVDAAGVAHARSVTVGARDGASVEILDGLSGGESVVTTGAYGVTDGSSVRVGS